MTDPDFHLCETGQRLWDEWDKLRYRYSPENPYDCSSPEKTIQSNAAWIAYQDHRNLCKDCGFTTIA
jgi:hypothetical protein